MFRSSFFLMVSTVVTAGLGFLFWVIVARFYTPSQVGLATSLISASSLIAYLSLFGLNSTLIRFPAPPRARNAQISQAMAAVALIAAAASVVYLLGLPLYGHKLMFLRDRWPLALAFVVFCVCAALVQVCDAVYIGARAPEFNVLLDGFVQGLTRVLLPGLLTGLGAAGILMSSGGGFLVTALASLAVMHRKLGFRPDFRTRGTRLMEQLGFSLASYASSLLNLAPLMAVPLIVLAELGADQAGYYYVTFQISTLLTALSYAVGESLFAEVSTEITRFGVLLRRSAAIIAAVQLPAAAAVALGSGVLLRMFGGHYATEARSLLTVLAAGAAAVGLNTWASFALKFRRHMRALILSNVVYCGAAIGLAAAWAHRGLVWIGWAWAAGNLASGLYAAAALLLRWRATIAPAVPSRQWNAGLGDAALLEWGEETDPAWIDDEKPTLSLRCPWLTQHQDRTPEPKLEGNMQSAEVNRQ